MLELHGRQVFTELAEIVDPRHTALLLIDVTRDCCSPDGMFGVMGRDLSIINSGLRNLERVLESARAVGVEPIFVTTPWWPEHKNISGPWLRFMITKRRMDPAAQGCMVVGTPGVEFLPELSPREGEMVVSKWRSSSFVGSNLDMVLRCNDIKTVICTGVTTEGCVESTARDAIFYDYYTVVLEDCVGTYDRDLHEASLKVLRSRVDVARSEDVLAIWSTARTGASEEVA
jgi:nicotinamidase-related amidase